MIKKIFLTLLALAVLVAIAAGVYAWQSLKPTVASSSTIYLVPVYGQSLALGEETTLLTDYDSLTAACGHRLLGCELNEQKGYFHHESMMKQRLKLLLRSKNRLFETSCYMLGATLIDSLRQHGDEVSYVCTFQAGVGTTGIDGMKKGTPAYEKFLGQLRGIAATAKNKGCKVVFPAFCWVQGETDLTGSTDEGYAERLQQFRADLEADAKEIFAGQQDLFGGAEHLSCILYQTSSLAIAEDGFKPLQYESHLMLVPDAQRKLISTDTLFLASTPVYRYDVMREYVHIDNKGQQSLGRYEGRAVADLVLNGKRDKGLQCDSVSYNKNMVYIDFATDAAPLQIDTIDVNKVEGYGFTVITPSNNNILASVSVEGKSVILTCDSVIMPGYKVRYGLNGQEWKGGRKSGPRGNIRDAAPLPDYAYIFEETIK